MSEISLSILNTGISGEEPFSGDLKEGELAGNSSDGRLWIGDPFGNPVEIGGSVKSAPMGVDLNYFVMDFSNSSNLPIPIPDPSQVEENSYRSIRILAIFNANSPGNIYFDYPINWGIDQDPFAESIPSGKIYCIELFRFGPDSEWYGKVIWENSI